MKNILTFSLAILLSLVNCLTVLADAAASQKFEAANKLYREKKFDTAIAAYEELIKTNYESAEVYFNLGNAYYKSGQLANAILNYERSKIIHPNDEDIQHNLRLAYANTVDKIEPIPLLFYQRWWQSFLHLFSPAVWGAISIVLIWVTLVAGLLYLFARTVNAKRNYFLLTTGLLLLSFFIFYISYAAHEVLNDSKGAIITEPSAYIKSSPEEKSTNLFMLHEGTRVEVLEENDGWQRIKIANGNVGWIKGRALEKI